MYAVLRNSLLTDSKSFYAAKILLGSFFIALCAQISVPFYPVPMVLSVDAVLIIGLFCSPRVAFGATATYLIEALMGLPVLQGFSGGPVTFGPTGGYIIGFIAMATIISLLTHGKSGLIRKLFACLVGTIALYALGLAWLSQFTGFEKALELGLYPFALKAALSIIGSVFATELMQNLKNRWNKTHGNGI
ncbi:MAG: biotin transporter BioY [Alphaproteobacteria bacterium]